MKKSVIRFMAFSLFVSALGFQVSVVHAQERASVDPELRRQAQLLIREQRRWVVERTRTNAFVSFSRAWHTSYMPDLDLEFKMLTRMLSRLNEKLQLVRKGADFKIENGKVLLPAHFCKDLLLERLWTRNLKSENG